MTPAANPRRPRFGGGVGWAAAAEEKNGSCWVSSPSWRGGGELGGGKVG